MSFGASFLLLEQTKRQILNMNKHNKNNENFNDKPFTPSPFVEREYKENSYIIVKWYNKEFGYPPTSHRRKITIVLSKNTLWLGETIDSFCHIKIENMEEIKLEDEIQESNQYKCNYVNGMIYFHDDMIGKEVIISFCSRGYIELVEKDSEL